MTLLIHRVGIHKPQSTFVNKAMTLIESWRFAVGTVASKRMDRLGTFL